ncbi:TPA: tape measure protein [Haemophilus influenzae]|uniref:tape measure protein n=1 Tax=Haemophilus influenzae TaxID=727 RepID=UPI000D01837D|nr:tape measure protein [Haemophilus influenzae]MCK8813510.1 tape measure protein [Haemophilus influenzae]MCK8850165.1 tape measure protein [Haemophilus influenzae]MCK8888470.1 tape measure protein [Haemophilus influenzae]MCK8893510.1 tape measure protein [Haemophilus influenzae]MCK8921443.1 tape measure protein [Haemophilus influenzae]
MNAIRELVTLLRYKVDNSGLKAYVVQTQQAAKGIRSNLNNAVDGLRAKFSGAAVSVKEVGNNLKDAKNQMLSLRNLVGGYFAMVAGGSAIKIADEWAAVDSRVKLATKSAEEHKYALSQIFDLSQRSGQDYLASADLFSKVNRSAGDLGLSLDDTLNLTEIIGQTMTIGGGDQGAQQAALMQLGQALGSGALRGDELNSIIEQAPRLANAIADSFGVPIGQLKDLGKEGKLTSKELAQGLLKQADKIQKEFDQMPKTFGRGMTILKNKAGQLIDVAVNKVSKLGAAFYNAAEWVTENIRLVGFLAGTVIGGKLMFALAASKKSLRQLLMMGARAVAPYLAMAAAAGVVALVLEDIYGWTQGDLSFTGALVGRYEVWADKFAALGKLADKLWINVRGLLKDLSRMAGVEINFDSWQAFATDVLEYIIAAVRNLINTVSGMVRIIRALINGDYAGAWSSAGDMIDGLSLKFLPLYSVGLMVLGGILSAVWALFFPFRAFFGLLKGGFRSVMFVAKPFIKVAKGIASPFIWAQKHFKLFSRVGSGAFSLLKRGAVKFGVIFKSVVGIVVKGIFAIGRSMFMAVASNPILLAISAVIGLVILLVVYWDEVKAFAIAAWEAISKKAAEIWQSIITGASEMWDNITNKAAESWDNVKKDAGEKWNSVTMMFKNAWQKSIDTVVGWFNSLIPSWIRDLFSDGAKAEVKLSGEALTIPVSSHVSPQRLGYGGRPIFAPNQNMTQTNNFNIQSSANPSGVANAVSDKLSRGSSTSFGMGAIEYAG